MIQHKTGVILLALLLAAMAMVPMVSALEQTDGLENVEANAIFFEKAQLYLIEENHADKSFLKNLNIVTAVFPTIEKKIIGVKILDEKTQDIYAIYLDDTNTVVDPKKYSEEESGAYFKRYGKIEPELKEKLTELNENDRIKVWIWMKEPAGIDVVSAQLHEKSQDRDLLNREREIYKGNSHDLVAQLKEKGFTVNYVSEYSPSFFAELTRDMIEELEKDPEVSAVYISRTYELQLYNTAKTVKANSVWNSGYSGSGVQVAIVETDGIEFNNPYLADGSYFNPLNPNVDSHATAVAGIIASTHSTNKGIAYGVPALLSANAAGTSTADMVSAMEWAISNYASILQNSWGLPDPGYTMLPIDRYMDHVAWTNHKTIVVSAGNLGFDNARITSPAKAYNILTVGGFLDQDTPSWSDDVIAGYSSYADPSSTNGDREKPEVVAVSGFSDATSIDTTSASYPWIEDAGSGTSFAAPVVSGGAALLMQRQPQLTSWPETVKAIIMASAVHNIEGNSRLSEKDGAGGIDLEKAFGVANNNQFQSNSVIYSSFPLNYYVNALAGQKVRAVISWNSQPDNNHPPLYDDLKTDLDLVVFGPTNNFVTTSNSYDNNYEIVEFTAPTTGQYRLQNTRIRFDGSSDRVGFAYCYV